MIRNIIRTLHIVPNFYNGQWYKNTSTIKLSNDLHISNTPKDIDFTLLDIGHSPYYNTHKYREFGDICGRLSNKLMYDSVDYNILVNRIEKVYPKSRTQIEGEINLTRRFLQNLGGDSCQFIVGGKATVGDYIGQHSIDWRMPYGRVAIISPFNFPIEIPVLQTMGSLVTGNIPLIHVDHRVCYAMEHFVTLMLECGVSPNSFLFINGYGKSFEKVLLDYNPIQTVFTGSSKVAGHLIKILDGKVKIEDSGFNWKYLGVDVFKDVITTNKVLETALMDAYENSGQKCSSQRLLFVPNNKIDYLKGYLNNNLMIEKVYGNLRAPLMSVSENDLNNYIENAKRYLSNIDIIQHSNNTAIFCDIEEFYKNIDNLAHEIFAPVQYICGYNTLEQVTNITKNIRHQLTCAICTNDLIIQNKLLANSRNGTTYVGLNARTTGTLENRHFGPGGDPRAGSIGTAQSIRDMWTYNRCVISDFLI
jgi:1-pyrroline-5-carboxylate dehydrogenase